MSINTLSHYQKAYIEFFISKVESFSAYTLPILTIITDTGKLAALSIYQNALSQSSIIPAINRTSTQQFLISVTSLAVPISIYAISQTILITSVKFTGKPSLTVLIAFVYPFSNCSSVVMRGSQKSPDIENKSQAGPSPGTVLAP